MSVRPWELHAPLEPSQILRTLNEQFLVTAMVRLQEFIFAFLTVASTVAGQSCATINPAYAPTWGAGFSGRVVMNGLKSPRGIIFDSMNNLLVVEAGGAGVRYVKLTDNGGTNVCVGSSKQLIPERGVSNNSPSR